MENKEGQDDARKLSVTSIPVYKNILFRNLEPEMAAAEKRESPFDNRGSFKRKQRRRPLLSRDAFSSSIDSIDGDVFLANPENSESKLLGFQKPKTKLRIGSSAERVVKARLAAQEIEMEEKAHLSIDQSNYGAVGENQVL